jgi:MFS transporter, PAT family, beta-lactamase induction signal transducer AmpG
MSPATGITTPSACEALRAVHLRTRAVCTITLDCVETLFIASNQLRIRKGIYSTEFPPVIPIKSSLHPEFSLRRGELPISNRPIWDSTPEAGLPPRIGTGRRCLTVLTCSNLVAPEYSRMSIRHCVPVWLMGLTNLSYGLYGGVIAFAIPQLLGNRLVPEATIAGLTAVAISPGFWAFLVSPILDVRFSRRFYAVALASFASLTLVVAFLSLAHLGLLQAVLTVGFLAAYLYQSAVGGWLSSITSAEEENLLSVWITIGNVGGFSLMAIGCNQIVRHLSPPAAAVVLAASILVPTVPFLFMQAPGPDRRLASESFPQFFGDILSLVKRRQVLVAVVLFVSPAATFSLTNFLGGRGSDFHASPGFVGLVGGVGVALGGIVGCLVFPALCRLMPLRPFYLAVGVAGALCTLSLIPLPRVPASFAVVLIAENLFQCLAITACTAITFETIGRDNPLASTTFCFLGSAYGVPISYMLYVDAFGYARGGISGSLTIDAVTGIVSSVLLGLMLFALARKSGTRPSQA